MKKIKLEHRGRYSYKNKVFIYGEPVEVDDDLAKELLAKKINGKPVFSLANGKTSVNK